MRICVVSLNRFVHDPPARAAVRSLVRAGHDVVVVAAGREAAATVDGAELRYVPTRYPAGRGKLRRWLRRAQPPGLRRILFHRALTRTAAATGATVFQPTSAAAVPLAARAARRGGAVARPPQWPDAGRADLIHLAPARPELSLPASSPPLAAGATPVWQPTEGLPTPGRHHGLRLALCYRKTDTNPGRYLEAALLRAGVEVEVHTDEVDRRTMAPGLDGVVFVESPYPALRIAGRNPGVPTLFWVHHGEHRLMTNLRLCERYEADAVLLAHSWHLAHRFPVPVHRFPFGVAPELQPDGATPLAARRYDVGFVGAGIDDESEVYRRRRRVLGDIEAMLGPERVMFRNRVSAADMADIYAGSKIVVDEGGTAHHPITMRVFEAVGAGAMLVTDPAPGIEQLFEDGIHFAALSEEPGAQVAALLENSDVMAAIAARGRAEARARHTYDHRVDRLVDILSGTARGEWPERPLPQGVARLVADDVDIQRIVTVGGDGLERALPTHEVWRGEVIVDRLGRRSFDAAVVLGDSDLTPAAVESAYRFVYVAEGAGQVEELVKELRPGAAVSRHDGMSRFDVEGR